MSVPSNSINHALQLLFSDQSLGADSDVVQQGVSAIKQHFKQISRDKYGYTISAEVTINALGYDALFKQNIEQAQHYFQANIDSFPSSPNIYDSMADALAANQKLAESGDKS